MRRPGETLWAPSPDRQRTAALDGFADWLATHRGLRFDRYDDLWKWSTEELEAFWGAIWEYFEVGAGDPGEVLPSRVMPGANWFPNTTVNYAQEVLRRAPRDAPALVVMREDAPTRELQFDELWAQVGALAATLRQLGVQPGDRVAAFLPNVPEAIVGLLASASMGAIWTACAPDFGTQSVLDRFVQADPVVLLAVDGYRFNGRRYDRRDVVGALQQALPSLRATIWRPEGHRPEPWRRRRRAPEGAEPRVGRPQGRPHVLLQLHQLDGVELARRRAARGCDARGVRRQPRVPRCAGELARRRRVAGERVRYRRGLPHRV
jgi:acetoacetyl-CoA synthetase